MKQGLQKIVINDGTTFCMFEGSKIGILDFEEDEEDRFKKIEYENFWMNAQT